MSYRSGVSSYVNYTNEFNNRIRKYYYIVHNSSTYSVAEHGSYVTFCNTPIIVGRRGNGPDLDDPCSDRIYATYERAGATD
jgi:hypothetical protein